MSPDSNTHASIPATHARPDDAPGSGADDVDAAPSGVQIAVVVVSHQSVETLDDCLQRLRGAAGVASIRVVDNGSDDGSVDVLQRHAAADPRLRFIANPDNPGFAAACNLGAADNGRGSWLALVNPDCLLEPDTLVRLADLAASLDDALLGADLVDEAGERDTAARRRDPDFAQMLAGVARAPGAATQLGVRVDDKRELQVVDAVSGALMLMPRALFKRLGGFDEGYRLHAEDLDLCRRARQAGATVAVANDVRVLHVRGVSSRARPVFVEWHKHRGLWRYFCKFEAPGRRLPTRCAVFTAIWLRFPIAALRRVL